MLTPVSSSPRQLPRLLLAMAGSILGGCLSFWILLLIFVPSASAAINDRTMYFTVNPGEGIPITDKPVLYSTVGNLGTAVGTAVVDLSLEIRTLSIKDRDTFVLPTVDDYYRQTEPSPANSRVPNVTFEAFENQNGVSKPVRLRVSDLGGGMDIQYLEAKIELLFGGDEDKLATERKRIHDLLVAKTITQQDAQVALSKAFVDYLPNQPGVYHIRATYSPNVDGKWKGVLKTNLITIVIKETRIQATPIPAALVKP